VLLPCCDTRRPMAVLCSRIGARSMRCLPAGLIRCCKLRRPRPPASERRAGKGMRPQIQTSRPYPPDGRQRTTLGQSNCLQINGSPATIAPAQQTDAACRCRHRLASTRPAGCW